MKSTPAPSFIDDNDISTMVQMEKHFSDVSVEEVNIQSNTETEAKLKLEPLLEQLVSKMSTSKVKKMSTSKVKIVSWKMIY